MIIHIGPKFCTVGHVKVTDRTFVLKFYVTVFRASLFFYLIDKREFRRAILSGDRSCLKCKQNEMSSPVVCCLPIVTNDVEDKLIFI